jgi:hypothetical protein
MQGLTHGVLHHLQLVKALLAFLRAMYCGLRCSGLCVEDFLVLQCPVTGRVTFKFFPLWKCQMVASEQGSGVFMQCELSSSKCHNN